MTLENAIARSISHTEIVRCEFDGEYSDLLAWLNDNITTDNTVSEENDGTIDVAGDDWRVNVTLVAHEENANVTIKIEAENNAEAFWSNLDEQFPAVADQLRDSGVATVDAATWESIQALDGFSDGPDYARHALVESCDDE